MGRDVIPCGLLILVSAAGCGSFGIGGPPSGVLFAPGSEKNELACRAAGIGNDGLVVLGRSEGDLDLGGGPQAKGGMFVVRLDRQGRPAWDRRFPAYAGPADLDGPYGNVGIGFPTGAIAAGPGSAIFAAGSFGGEVDFGGGVRTSHRAGFSPSWPVDAVVLKLDGTGQRLWDWTFGADGTMTFVTEIAATPDGGAVVAVLRHPESTACVSGAQLGPMLCDGSEAVLVSLTPDGAPGWQVVLPEGYVSGLAVDAAGNALVASRCHFLKIRPDGTQAFDVDGPLCGGTGVALRGDSAFFTGTQAGGSSDHRLARRSLEDGSVLWSRPLPIGAARLRADVDGNAHVMTDVMYGFSTVRMKGGTFDFGCGGLEVPVHAVVAAVLDASGTCLRHYAATAPEGYVRGLDIAPSGPGSAWVAGGFARNVRFENGPRSGVTTYEGNPHGEATQDVFVERFDF